MKDEWALPASLSEQEKFLILPLKYSVSHFSHFNLFSVPLFWHSEGHVVDQIDQGFPWMLSCCTARNTCSPLNVNINLMQPSQF
jgi:hypothetical protein